MKTFLLLLLSLVGACSANAADLESRVKHGCADSSGVKIHYVSVGSGPLIVMIHGFPDYWYTWRRQMEGLEDKFQVVAIDQRGYNLSDKPEGVSNYEMRLLVGDVICRDQACWERESHCRGARLGRCRGLGCNYPPAKPEALRLLAPQRGLIAIG